MFFYCFLNHCCAVGNGNSFFFSFFFFQAPQYWNMFHSIREWKLDAWKCKELDISPPKPLRYIKKCWLTRLSQLRACSACEDGFPEESTLMQHVTPHKPSPVLYSVLYLWAGWSWWKDSHFLIQEESYLKRSNLWHFHINRSSFWHLLCPTEITLGDSTISSLQMLHLLFQASSDGSTQI